MKKITMVLIAVLTIAAGVLIWYKYANINATHQIKSLDSEEISELSIFNLPSTWHDQNNQSMLLKDYHGRVNVMTLIFTRCEYACPRLVADVKNIESKFTAEELKKINFILVSIDPENDTPEVLIQYAKDKELDLNHWTLLNGNTEDVLELAMTLGVKYKKVSPIDFSHSNIISVFTKNGDLKYQQEGFGNDVEKVVEEIKNIL